MQRMVQVKKDKLSIIKFQVELTEPELNKEFIKDMRRKEKEKAVDFVP